MLSNSLMAEIERSGFAYSKELIHLFVGGSELHGAKVGATDDLDIYGIFVEEPKDALGLTPRDHFVWSTASDDRRNGPGDVDVTLYSLRRWAELAAKGNATALHFLFADSTATYLPTWTYVQDHRVKFYRNVPQNNSWDLQTIRNSASLVKRGTAQRVNVWNT